MDARTVAPTRPSESTVRYLTDLVRDREAVVGQSAAEALAQLTRWLARPTTSQRDASEMIERLKRRPRRAAEAAPVAAVAEPARRAAPYPEVPDALPSAKFAVETDLLVEAPPSWRSQSHLFFEVKQLRGKRVVRRLTGAPGRFTRGAVPAPLASELFLLLGDADEAFRASLLFGELYQVCGRCGAELTDDTSRENKFGPVCWALMAPWRKTTTTTMEES